MGENNPCLEQHYFEGDIVEIKNWKITEIGRVIGIRKSKYGRINYNIELPDGSMFRCVLFENINLVTSACREFFNEVNDLYKRIFTNLIKLLRKKIE